MNGVFWGAGWIFLEEETGWGRTRTDEDTSFEGFVLKRVFEELVDVKMGKWIGF